MEIHSKQELKFFIFADRMMNKGVFDFSFREKIRRFFFPDYRDLILDYLASMRRCSFYKHNTIYRGG